jgi:hypothetical protein
MGILTRTIDDYSLDETLVNAPKGRIFLTACRLYYDSRGGQKSHNRL